MATKREDIKVTIGEDEWTIRFSREDLGLDQWGVCAPGMKLIVVEPTLRGTLLVDTVVHEILHACLWNINEEAISATAGVLTQVLVDAGFMKKAFSHDISCQAK